MLLVIADVVRSGILGIHAVVGVFVGAVSGFAVSELFTRAARRYPVSRRLVRDGSSLLIRDGQPMANALFRASISLPQLRAIARRAGFRDLAEVRTAILEENGVVTLHGARSGNGDGDAAVALANDLEREVGRAAARHELGDPVPVDPTREQLGDDPRQAEDLELLGAPSVHELLLVDPLERRCLCVDVDVLVHPRLPHTWTDFEAEKDARDGLRCHRGQQPSRLRAIGTPAVHAGATTDKSHAGPHAFERHRCHAQIVRCVIVDDSSRFLESVGRLLEREGLEVVGVASSSAQGIRRVEELKPDVTLVDVALGEESGFDLVKQIGSPTILISTSPAEEFGSLIEASPALGFLNKAHISARSIRELVDHKPGTRAPPRQGLRSRGSRGR